MSYEDLFYSSESEKEVKKELESFYNPQKKEETESEFYVLTYETPLLEGNIVNDPSLKNQFVLDDIKETTIKKVNEIKAVVIYKSSPIWFIFFILSILISLILAGITMICALIIALKKWKHEDGFIKWLKVFGLTITGPISLPIMIFMGRNKVEDSLF